MKINLLIIPFLVLFLSGCDNENKSDANKTSDATPTTTTSAPSQSTSIEAPFELTLMDESKMTLQKFDKGFKVEGNDEAILFNFFATWCPPCKAEIPHLNNLSDKFKGKLKKQNLGEIWTLELAQNDDVLGSLVAFSKV